MNEWMSVITRRENDSPPVLYCQHCGSNSFSLTCPNCGAPTKDMRNAPKPKPPMPKAQNTTVMK